MANVITEHESINPVNRKIIIDIIPPSGYEVKTAFHWLNARQNG